MSVQPMNFEKLVQDLNKLIEKENSIYDEQRARVCRAWKEKGQAVYLIWLVNQKLGFNTRTLACAVQILDRFLGAVKVQSKYLRCVALASYHITLKLLEEVKNVPKIDYIIQTGGCTFSPGDLHRMESLILRKLDWDVNTPSAYDFLEVLFGIFCYEPQEVGSGKTIHTVSVFEDMCDLLRNCICSSRFSEYKNSTLALSVMSTVLAKHSTNWYTCFSLLQKQMKGAVGDFLHCRDLVTSIALLKKQSAKPLMKPKVLKCSALSPIKENPFEIEYAMYCERKWQRNDAKTYSDAQAGHGVRSSQADGTLTRHGDEIDVSLPVAKRPRIVTCGAQCRMDDDACPILTSPTKSIKIYN